MEDKLFKKIIERLLSSSRSYYFNNFEISINDDTLFDFDENQTEYIINLLTNPNLKKSNNAKIGIAPYWLELSIFAIFSKNGHHKEEYTIQLLKNFVEVAHMVNGEYFTLIDILDGIIAESQDSALQKVIEMTSSYKEKIEKIISDNIDVFKSSHEVTTGPRDSKYSRIPTSMITLLPWSAEFLEKNYSVFSMAILDNVYTKNIECQKVIITKIVPYIISESKNFLTTIESDMSEYVPSKEDIDSILLLLNI